MREIGFGVVLAIIGSWTLLVLRDRPLRMFLVVFFLAALVGIPAEVITLRVFQVYEWRMKMLPDPKDDVILGSIVVAWSNSLLGVIFARYCKSAPIRRAFLGALGLSCVEVGLVKTGYMVYWHWSPLYSAVFFFCYFMLIWLIVREMTVIPLWLVAHGMALWICFLVDSSLQGMFWLWHFDIRIFGDIVRDNRLVSTALHSLIIVPIVTYVSTRRHLPLLWAGGASALLLVLEDAGISAGVIVHDSWSLWWSAVKYVGIFAVALPHVNWLRTQGID